MSQPIQHRVHRANLVSRRQNRTVDHQNRQAKLARRQYLGLCPATTGIFGHHQFDIMVLQQSGIPSNSKRPARDYDTVMRQWRRHIGRIDQPQQILMLWTGAELSQMHAPNSQHNPLCRPRKRRDSRGNIADILPIISCFLAPRRARQSQQPGRSSSTGHHRIFTHLGRKRMRSVNHMGDFVIPEILRQTANAPKAADPTRDRLLFQTLHTAGIRQGRRHTLFGNRTGQRTGLEGAPQNKQVRRHG